MHFRSVSDWTFRYVIALAGMAIAGCGGSDLGRVNGTLVHEDGTPLANARVVARSTETAKTTYASTDAEGYFEFPDAIEPGDYAVVILEDQGDPDNHRKPTIAAKYRNAEESGVRLSVEAGGVTKLNLTLDKP